MWNLIKINVQASSLTRHLLVIVTLCEGPAIGARIKVPAPSSRVCRQSQDSVAKTDCMSPKLVSHNRT